MIERRYKVLVVDDEAESRKHLQRVLGQRSFDIVQADCGEAALAEVWSTADPPSVVLLDSIMPGLDGIATLRRLRQFSRVPVMMLSARSEPSDCILSLECGADDYLEKPFRPDELLARVRRLLRYITPSAPDVIECDELQLFALQGRAVVRDHELPLTRIEFLILATLAMSWRSIVSRAELCRATRCETLQVRHRAIDVHICNLRRKLSEAPAGAPQVVTVRRAGYQLATSSRRNFHA